MITSWINKARNSVTYRKIKGLTCSMPNFLIIGAQKCGTSSLYQYLIQHPFVIPARGFVDSRKEARFFTRHFNHGKIWYRSHFPSRFYKIYFKIIHKQKLISGESTPSYIFFPRAHKRIFNTIPQVKLIIILRNPIERAYSHYQHVVRIGKETLSFERAIELEFNRIHGERERMIEERNYISFEYMYHSYLTRGIYADQMEQWFKLFPKEQFLILQSETFFNNPSDTYEQVLEFLNLPSCEQTPNCEPIEYEQKNVGIYKKINPDTRRALADYFKPHNQRLYNLINQQMQWN